MTQTLDFGFGDSSSDDGDNVTDWCLEKFHARYRDESITKDDIWEYLYGVMHAPDWRDNYKHDLQRNLPRVPFAPDFEAFRSAGPRNSWTCTSLTKISPSTRWTANSTGRSTTAEPPIRLPTPAPTGSRSSHGAKDRTEPRTAA